jgi:plastocyanin
MHVDVGHNQRSSAPFSTAPFLAMSSSVPSSANPFRTPAAPTWARPARVRAATSLASAFVALAIVASCSAPPPPPPPSGGGKQVDPTTTGDISGRVGFTGTPPPVDVIRVGIDPVCAQTVGANVQSQAVLVGKDGALENVFVYVKDGLDPAYTFAIPTTPVTLDQRGCRYTPRVFGVRAGQPVEILNSDATLHNVHALPMMNQEFNQGEPTQGARMQKTFTVPEVMVRFKCDVHAWMTAYVGVMTHPFFAVTGADGTFSIQGLPPGTYTLEAWHEKFGTRTANVTITEHQTQHASFSFSGH